VGAFLGDGKPVEPEAVNEMDARVAEVDPIVFSRVIDTDGPRSSRAGLRARDRGAAGMTKGE
jgi:hypothetical protein